MEWKVVIDDVLREETYEDYIFLLGKGSEWMAACELIAQEPDFSNYKLRIDGADYEITSCDAMDYGYTITSDAFVDGSDEDILQVFNDHAGFMTEQKVRQYVDKPFQLIHYEEEAPSVNPVVLNVSEKAPLERIAEALETYVGIEHTDIGYLDTKDYLERIADACEKLNEQGG